MLVEPIGENLHVTAHLLPAMVAAGFAEMPQLHNAAHDGRHSAAFPCH